MVIRAALLCLLATPALAEKTLEIVAAPLSPRIVEGEMIPVTIRGIYDTKIAIERLTILPSDRFDWVQLTDDDWREERIEGRNRIVFERRLALFARQTGIASFGPAEHELTVINAASRREPVTVESHRLDLSIAPLPFTERNGWHFAARSLTLTDDLSTRPDRLEDGETVTRRVTLRAEGALPEMLPPRPVVSENWLITFAAPIERSMELTPDGPVSTVIWTWQFRPETGEPGVLEPVAIPYFNTTSRRIEQVEIPALPIGYASFERSRVVGGDIGWTSRAMMAGGLALGLMLGTAAILRGNRTTHGMLRALARRWSPLPAWHLRQAERSGDLLALRRAAAEWVAARPERATGAAEALREMDRAIYARAPRPKDLARRLRSTEFPPRPAPDADAPPPRS